MLNFEIPTGIVPTQWFPIHPLPLSSTACQRKCPKVSTTLIDSCYCSNCTHWTSNTHVNTSVLQTCQVQILFGNSTFLFVSITWRIEFTHTWVHCFTTNSIRYVSQFMHSIDQRCFPFTRIQQLHKRPLANKENEEWSTRTITAFKTPFTTANNSPKQLRNIFSAPPGH